MFLAELLLLAIVLGVAFFALLYVFVWALLVSGAILTAVFVFIVRFLFKPVGMITICVLLFWLLAANYARAADARPGKWCGWYARHHLVSVDPGKEYNRACEWRKWGQPSDARVGAIVVWCGGHNHVGKITGTDANGNFIVKSGNDGGAVRERVRSVSGASFRIEGFGG